MGPNEWYHNNVVTKAVKGLNIFGAIAEAVTVHYKNEPVKGKGKGIFNGAPSSTQRRMESALDKWGVSNNQWHPWGLSDAVYIVSPEPEYIGTTLDMAYIAATIAKAYPDQLYCGECGPDGKFLPLSTPVLVGATATSLHLPIVVPEPSANLVAVTGAEVIPVRDISDLERAIFENIQHVPVPNWESLSQKAQSHPDDMNQIKGQQAAKEALEIAVAGGHNLLFMGPPGEGKSALSKRAYTIAPPLTRTDAIEVTRLWQAAERISGSTLLTVQPFVPATREASREGLLGGGSTDGPRPGSVSLAHKGVLFADEMFLWTPTRIDSLRTSLQDKQVTISRKDWQITFPADYQLIAAANPCPCGFWGHPERECVCTDTQRARYLARASGAVMDRIDLKVWLPPLLDQAFEEGTGEDSASIRTRVVAARKTQEERYEGLAVSRNAELGPGLIEELCLETDEARGELKKAYRSLKLSTRGLDILRKVARTCADLRGSEVVEGQDVERAERFVGNEYLNEKE